MAVEQAKIELAIRNVPVAYENKKVAVFKRYDQKKKQVAVRRKAKERFEWDDFLFRFDQVLLEVFFDWDMKKDGYLTKHRQRKYILTILAFLILITILFQ